MTRRSIPVLILMLALAATLQPADAPLETVRAGNYSGAAPTQSAARILNWNIDRGKHLQGILAAIRETHPDLCIFQEVDLGARRTGGLDVAQELAKAFSMNYAFAPEFRELSQGTAAYHGQAILTTFPIRSSRILRFTHQSGFWKPQPLLISSLPIFQRREGGRIALVNELDRAGQLLQLEEVLRDTERYPASTAVIIAGDLNALHRHSPVIPRLRSAGYRSCFGEKRVRTHVLIGDLDWIFVRGPLACEGAQVHRDFHASDHFPISAELRF